MIGYVELEEAKKFLEERYSNINEEKLKRALYQAFDKIENIGAREGTDKGTAYDEIVSNVGLPFYQIISGENNQLKLRITYNNPKGWKERNKLQTVILEFYNQEDGTWRLVSKQSQ